MRAWLNITWAKLAAFFLTLLHDFLKTRERTTTNK